jgi:hypothetical protein
MEEDLLPYELDYPTGGVGDNIPSWPNVIDDCVSRGKFYLRHCGAAYAFSAVGQELMRMSLTTHWRAVEAAKLYSRIRVQMLAEVQICTPLVALSNSM